VDRKWIYTAVTRATELKNVTFYSYTEDGSGARELYWLDKYLKRKIDGYRHQDATAGRRVEEGCSYVTTGWLRDCLGKSCGNCGDCLTYDCDENHKITSNLTAQRIDNSLPHTTDNIVPYCAFCNCSLGKRET